MGPGRGPNRASGGPIWDPILGGLYGLNHIDGRLGAQCILAITGLKWGTQYGFGTLIWDPFYSSSMGPNHIDARLGGHCNYGILGPYWVPHLGPTPGSKGWPMGDLNCLIRDPRDWAMGFPINPWDLPSTHWDASWDGSWDCPSTHWDDASAHGMG